MGGAERAARKRRQEQNRQRSGGSAGAASVPKTRGGSGVDKRVIFAVIAVVVLAGAVIGGIMWSDADKNKTEGVVIGAATPAASPYPEIRDGLVVVSGNPQAKTTIDVYADFLCPICGQFERDYNGKIQEQVRSGTLQLRTHMVPLLVEASDPAGYSLDSANAALLAADAGKFSAFHDSLFAAQPEEGKRGYDKGQLIALGAAVGITDPAFAAGIQNGVYNQQLTAEMTRINGDASVHQKFPNGSTGFGTPTVISGGQVVSFTDPEWLAKLIAAAPQA